MGDLLAQIDAMEDVQEETLVVPEWNNMALVFRGMSYAALMELQDVDLEAAAAGDKEQAIKLVQATACDPETKDLIFIGAAGASVLRRRNFEVVLRLLNQGALVVLGVDVGETAGKDSSSTAKGKKQTA